MSIRRVYETTTIINAALEPQDIEGAVNKITSFIENHGGVVEETNKWGNRRLAYPISKRHHGYYVHFVYNIQPAEVPILERFLVLDDTILRHLTLLLEPELREYRKQKSLSEGKSGETILSSIVEVEKPVIITALPPDIANDTDDIDDIVIDDSILEVIPPVL
ncbi:MAG: 30S ribosomal protein S6 [Ignavibacteria bacterium]|jgi:small subunit ribosomal protein S6|nr:30S ribosomal protein S6 [Ignavibacteria bacterium]